MKISKWPFQVYGMELRKIITYRADFWINFIGQTIFSIIIAYFLWVAIFEAKDVSEMQGFTLNKIIFYYLIVPIVFRIQQGETIGGISREIYEGSLNKYILYPINFFKYKIITYLAHSTFFFAQLCLIMSIYLLFFETENFYSFSIIDFLLFTVLIFFSTLCYFSLNAISELIAFWADNIWSLGVIIRFMVKFLGGAMIPLVFFPTLLQDALEYTPFPYIIHFPMKVFFGEYSQVEYFQNLFILNLWTCAFLIITRFIWNKGKLQYTGVGI